MDLAILSARVFTGNEKQPWAEAIRIKDRFIEAVGSNEEVRKTCGKDTEIVELPGRLITPGLVDAHCHFVSLGRTLKMVDLRNLPNIEACRERIKEAAAEAKPGKWILGRGWNHHQWEESREPSIEDIDDITPNNPAMMVRACGHSIWLNSQALEKANITANTPEPPGGKIERYADGKPNGIIKEARKLIEAQIPPLTDEDWKEAALAAQKEALSKGLTGVHTNESLQEWKVLSALDAESKLKIRVHHALQTDDMDEAKKMGIIPSGGNDRLWFGHVKLFADGSLGAGTALMHEPYTDEPDSCGIPFLTLDELTQKVQKAYSLGASVKIHAIGDLAVTNGLVAIETSRKDHPGERRDAMEHVQLFRLEDLDKFKELNVVASVQPAFVPSDWPAADKRWGKERCKKAGYAWKKILDAGVLTQFGSDAPVEPIDPMIGLVASVARTSLDGKPEGGWFPEGNLTLEETIAGFTKTAAWSARKENVLGSIEKGKWADLTIFEKDLSQVPVSEWKNVKIEKTIIDGEIVYEK